MVSSRFLGASECASTELILLESSGNQERLHLREVTSVWLCPDSLGPSLQELVITNVDEIKIAPRVLAHRLTDFTLRVNGVQDKLAFSKEALVVEAGEITNADDVSNSHMESALGYHHSLRIRVFVVNANYVTFETKSVSGPYVWVDVQHSRKLKIETQGMEAVLNLTLSVSSTRSLEMEPNAVVINKLQVTDLLSFLLMKESVTVKAPGGHVILRNITRIVAYEKSFILGRGATLELSEIFIVSSFSRAFFAESLLDSVMLTEVMTNPIANSLCLATHNLTMHRTVISGCVKFREHIGGRGESPVALCKVNSMEEMADPCHCTEPRCGFCAGQ